MSRTSLQVFKFVSLTFFHPVVIRESGEEE